MSNATRWAIAGTGRISGLFADCITRTGSGTVAHVLSRTREGAEAFAGPRGATPWSDQRSMLSGAEIDALYIGTPHSEHAELAIQALSVGVPVLCEKPLSCSGAGTLAVVMAAHQNGTALVEGWMYRFHPQVDRLLGLLRSGAIGELRSIRSSFGFRADVPADHDALVARGAQAVPHPRHDVPVARRGALRAGDRGPTSRFGSRDSS